MFSFQPLNDFTSPMQFSIELSYQGANVILFFLSHMQFFFGIKKEKKLFVDTDKQIFHQQIRTSLTEIFLSGGLCYINRRITS